MAKLSKFYSSNCLIAFFIDSLFNHILFPRVGETKIDELEFDVLITLLFSEDEEVFRFKVPVDYFLVVAILDCFSHLLKKYSDIVFGNVRMFT